MNQQKTSLIQRNRWTNRNQRSNLKLRNFQEKLPSSSSCMLPAVIQNRWAESFWKLVFLMSFALTKMKQYWTRQQLNFPNSSMTKYSTHIKIFAMHTPTPKIRLRRLTESSRQTRSCCLRTTKLMEKSAQSRMIQG